MGRRFSSTLTRLVLAGSVALVALPAGSAAGAVEGSYSATGAASGVLLQFSVPGAPLQDTVIDAGGPTARVLLDSLGASRGYASFPFPGEIPAAGPGLFRGLTEIPVPDYPLFVSSFHPSTPKSRFSGGGTELTSESDANSSRSSAESAGMASGADGNQGFGIARSQASAVATDDAIESLATSELTGVQIGPLAIGRIQSLARVVVDAGGQRVRTSELRIVGGEVDGQAVSFTGEGVVAQGEAVPGTTPVPVQEALAGSGIDLVVTAPTRTANGIAAPALQITRRFDSGETITATLASASAAVESSTAVDADASNAGAGTPVTGGPAPADEGPAPADGSPAPAGTPPGQDTSAPGPAASAPPDEAFARGAEEAMTQAAGTVVGADPMSGLINDVGLSFTAPAGGLSAGSATELAAPVVSAPSAATQDRARPARTAPGPNLAMAPLAHELVNRTTSTPAAFGVLLAGGLAAVGLVGALLRTPREARN